MKSRMLFLISCAVIGTILLGSCSSATTPTATAEPITAAATEAPAPTDTIAPTETPVTKVLLITGVGGLGDQGFNDAGNAGAQQAVTDLGIKLDMIEPTDASELEADYSSAAASGEYALIVGLGFEQADAANKVAKDFPNQKFTITDASSTESNVQGIVYREKENAFLAGVLAAYVTTQTDLTGINADKVLGIVLGIDAPSVRLYAYSYQAGAQTVDRDMQIQVGVVGNFTDTAKGKELALAQISQGADIVYQVAGGAGLGVFDAANEKGVYAIGEGANQNTLHPDFIIASTYKRMDTSVYNAIKSVLDGNWTGGNVAYGFSDGYLVVDLTGSNVAVSDEAKEALETYKQKIISGEIVPPTTQEELDAYLATLK
jgi:basic membrane protein A and related proteins